jgi:putrescine transport system permease protein
VIALPYLWLGVFFLLPLVALVLGLSLGTNAPTSRRRSSSASPSRASSCCSPTISTSRPGCRRCASPRPRRSSPLLLGYPMAYAIARAAPRRRPLLLMLVVLPFWTSFLIRVYAWMGLLSENGILNQFLRWSGLVADPGTILGTEWAVHLGIVYAYLPFMVLPLYATLEKLDWSLLEAASDLGAGRCRASSPSPCRCPLPGIVAGCLLVFIPAVGEFVIPDLLGGTRR